jgi:hypothetical protein
LFPSGIRPKSHQKHAVLKNIRKTQIKKPSQLYYETASCNLDKPTQVIPEGGMAKLQKQATTVALFV